MNCCANRLVVSQHCGGYDRRAQNGAQIPGYVHKFTHHNIDSKSKSWKNMQNTPSSKKKKKKKVLCCVHFMFQLKFGV